MSDSAYNNHVVRATLKQIIDLQGDEELVRLATTLPEEQKWQLDRVFEVARYIEGVLENTPSTLVSIQNLNGLQNGLAATQAELANFRANKNPGHLTNANAHIEQSVIPSLAGLLPTFNNTSPSKLGDIVDDIRARGHAAVAVLASEEAALNQKLAVLNTLIATQDLRIAELGTAVEAQKKEAVAVTAEVKGEYAKTEKELRDSFVTSVDSMQKIFKKFYDSATEESDQRLKVLNQKEEEARKIVQVVGNIGVTGNYQKIAQSETSTANLWRLVTIGFFAVGVILALSSFFIHLFQTPSIESFWTFAIRFATAFAIASPAIYTARESARHRTMADRARQRELELASLGPFIELLPESMKEEIRSKLVERYFGNEVEAHEIKTPIDPKDLMNLAGRAVDGLAKVAQKS